MGRITFSCVFVVLAFLLANTNGVEVGFYELKRGDFSVKLTNYGAVINSVILPDRNGKLDDVVLGFDSVDGYKNDTTYFGAVVGRVANRIGGAKFTLNGTTYNLVANEGNNILHGGPKGYGDVIWSVLTYKPDSHITFTYESSDGEEGFPGALSVAVTYMLIETNKLGVKFEAKAHNKATPVNLAQHAYWNLGGHNSGDILSHELQIFGSHITPVDAELIPTGELTPVKGTPFDFLELHKIGDRINELPKGYDINYALDGNSTTHFRRAAEVYDSVSGRRLQLWTTAPGVQLYTGNLVHDVKGKGGYIYKEHAALCLETQGFPDSVNHPNFPSQIVNPGETYKHIMVYRFTAH
ncbi:hypothetical protein CMV_002343 [Castanea mollissima]|uniref:Aldose 1-epimerase n=1 Tax=Castanea mollissima TaxID=60419 RepID=A0A8J4RYP8_9ROSI|nr:hypothetical protein CMV_002343 [Castanea mollissima]